MQPRENTSKRKNNIVHKTNILWVLKIATYSIKAPFGLFLLVFVRGRSVKGSNRMPLITRGCSDHNPPNPRSLHPVYFYRSCFVLITLSPRNSKLAEQRYGRCVERTIFVPAAVTETTRRPTLPSCFQLMSLFGQRGRCLDRLQLTDILPNRNKEASICDGSTRQREQETGNTDRLHNPNRAPSLHD